MATKKITDLQLRSDFDDTCLLPSDDATQTWRVTGAQIKAWINDWLTQPLSLVQSKTATFTADVGYDIYLCSASGGAFTANLPTAVGNGGKIFRFKKTDSSTNAVTVDGSGTETIDGATTFVLNAQYESVTVLSDGTNWLVVASDLENIAGYYTPTSGWGVGIPGASARVAYPATYTRMGKHVHVTGFAYFRNDSSTTNFTWSMPVTNGNIPTNVGGTMIRCNESGASATLVSRLNASASTSSAILWSNTGINSVGSDVMWAYSFNYKLA
jgi:hypothetical protein